MKISELEALVPALSGDFKSIQPLLGSLDKHLVLRTYLSGHALSELDTKIWLALRKNNSAVAVIRKTGPANLARWFSFVEQNHPEIQTEIKEKDAARLAKLKEESSQGGKYNLALQNTELGVVTRFLPEPSGYLHIGHAKAALLCDYFAHQAYNGTLRLRLDDTNPSKEKEEFQDAIIEDLGMMGIRPDKVTFTSDYFQYTYEMCVKLVEMGHAYADDTDMETMREERMTGTPSKHRDMSVEETLRIFHEMKQGSAEGLKNCLRAKISADNPNKAMRDPVIYRCNIEATHHRTGSTWKMYPMYDFACPVVDSHEGITHALRSTEYTDRNPQYQWFIDTLGIRQVYMWDFARMSFERTVLSKRKLTKLVDAGKVWGWDDPRMPTIRGVRRHGMTIDALREFILKQGPSRHTGVMDWTKFWSTNKQMIDPVAPRHHSVVQQDAVPVTLTGDEAPKEPFVQEKPKHVKNASVGTKKVTHSSSLLLDQADAAALKEGEEFTLMAWGNAIVRKIVRGGGDKVTGVTCELNLKGDFKTTEKKLTWLSAAGQELIEAEAWEFDHLLTKDKLEDTDELEEFLNPSTASMEPVLLGQDAASLKKDDIVQLERKGYFRVDRGLADWTNDEAGKAGRRVVLFGIPTGKGK